MRNTKWVVGEYNNNEVTNGIESLLECTKYNKLLQA